MNKKRYAIDGLFLTQNVTGIQRVALEITREIDKIAKKGQVLIVVPNIPLQDFDFKNIKVVRYGKHNGILWEQIDFASFLKKYNMNALCLTNTVPIRSRKGIVMIHDVSYKANPSFFVSFRDRLSAIWHRFNYMMVARSEMRVLTVSNFSKKEIQKYYKVAEERIVVVYNGWQHMERIELAQGLFDKYDCLKWKEYYFSMSTLAPNKNLKWIVEAARYNPDIQFVIAGGGKMENEGLPNVILLGYVSDQEAKTLMANCKAFLFPTFYEGFGLPPLEAIASGADSIIVSDTPCMREIYAGSANYLDPHNPRKWIIKPNKTNVKKTLDKYSWEKSAEIIMQLLR